MARIGLVVALLSVGACHFYAGDDPDDTEVVADAGDRNDATGADLDVLLLVDRSGSFGCCLASLRAQAPALHAALDASYPGVRIGVASFVDKPIAPFGTPAGGDFVYETNLALSPSAADLPAALFGLAIHIGGDGAEAQLEAVMHAALRRDEVGWDAHRTRIVVLLTHDVYHVAGDHSEASANNLDIVLDGTPPGAGEDYPSEADVGAILAAEGVRPVVVTSGSKPPYDALLGAWGFGEARAMEFDGANIATQIEIAVHAVVSP